MIEVIIKWHQKTKRYTPGHHSVTQLLMCTTWSEPPYKATHSHKLPKHTNST